MDEGINVVFERETKGCPECACASPPGKDKGYARNTKVTTRGRIRN